MKTFIFILVFLLAVPVFAADKSKKKKETIDLSCPKGVEGISKLAMTNPYDNEGRCFEYIGSVVQLLNKNKALFSYFSDYHPAAIIDFGNESAPVTFWGGLVKGRGAFVYETVSGSQKIIHSLVAIPKDKAKETYDKYIADKQQNKPVLEDNPFDYSKDQNKNDK